MFIIIIFILYGVKVALGNRGMTVEAARQCTYVTEWVSRGHFCLALCSFGPPSHALVVITWRGEGCRYMMRLGLTVKRAQLLKIMAQMSSIWAKGCILMTMCVLSDLTWLPLRGVGRKSRYIIIIFWFGSDMPSWLLFFHARFTSFHTHASLLTVFVCFFILFNSYCSRARVFGKTLVHEFPISYSNTEYYFFLSDSSTTCAQETLETR